jgi:hypothetical protein
MSKRFVVWKICLETRIQASKAVKVNSFEGCEIGGRGALLYVCMYAFASPPLSNGGVRRDHERVLTETEQEARKGGEGLKAKKNQNQVCNK